MTDTPTIPDRPPRQDVYVRVRATGHAGLRTQRLDDGVNIDWWRDRYGVDHVSGVEVIQARGVEIDGRRMPSPGADTSYEAAALRRIADRLDTIATYQARPGAMADVEQFADTVRALAAASPGADTPPPICSARRLARIWPSWAWCWVTCESPIRDGKCVQHGHPAASPGADTPPPAAPPCDSDTVDDCACGAGTSPPAEPGCERIADAIAGALLVAELDVAVSRSGTRLGEPFLALARCLDRAGLIDWSAFGPDDETGPEA